MINARKLLAILLLVPFISSGFYKPNFIDCEKASYDNTYKIHLTKRVTFDTTANLFHATLIDGGTGYFIGNAYLTFTQRSNVFHAKTNDKGEVQFFENNFSGLWQLEISHPHFICLRITNVQVGGGQWVIIKLKKR